MLPVRTEKKANPLPTRLHLGCGNKFIPGFFHIDAIDAGHIDQVGPVDRLDQFPDESMEIIYASHVLEHFGRYEYRQVLEAWCSKLKTGGILRLAVPDFEACVKWYLESGRSVEQILGLLIGGQRDQYDYHKMIFDQGSLTRALLDAGFSKVRRWDWRETEHSTVDDYSQAYLPHMDKESGLLMSLNLEAVK